jgi:hypothetical protein
MTKLTQAEIALIKTLLDAGQDLPHSFHERLFPSRQPEQTHRTHTSAHDTKTFTDALPDLPDDAPDMAALVRGNEIHLWQVPHLWSLAATLPIQFQPVEELLSHFDGARWLGEDEPVTVRAIIEHARRINVADLAYPIIISSDNHILDGLHRLAKAWITGVPTIASVQFPQDPTPDFRIPTDQFISGGSQE